MYEIEILDEKARIERNYKLNIRRIYIKAATMHA
jgi:hypothetical protein